MDFTFKCEDFCYIKFIDCPSAIFDALQCDFPTYVYLNTSNSFNLNTIKFEFLDVINLPEGLRYIKNSAYFESTYFLFEKKQPVIAFDVINFPAIAHFNFAKSISTSFLTDFLEILLHTNATFLERVFFHSGGIGVNDKAVIFAAWLNTGKTSTVLEFLRKKYSYLADEWSIIQSEGNAVCFDKRLVIYDKDLLASPEITLDIYGTIIGKIVLHYCKLLKPFKVTLIDFKVGFLMRCWRFLIKILLKLLKVRTLIHLDAHEINNSLKLRNAPIHRLYFLSRTNHRNFEVLKSSKQELVNKMLQSYRSELQMMFDTFAFKFVFPNLDFDFGLGIKESEVKRILNNGFSDKKIECYSVEIPHDKNPKEIVLFLEKHLKEH